MVVVAVEERHRTVVVEERHRPVVVVLFDEGQCAVVAACTLAVAVLVVAP